MIRNYNKEDLKSLKGIHIIDFYADWCGPCKMLSKVLEQIDEEIIKIDVDKEENLAKEYKVMSIPNLFILKDGEVKSQMIGFHSKDEIEKEITKVKEL